MPSFGDTALIALIALLLFGPKKLPELARQLGKLMGEFRRASNEFRMQMEDELRLAEQADNQKKITAMAPPAPLTEPLIDATNQAAVQPVFQDESIIIDHPHQPAVPYSENSIAAPTDAFADAAKPERHTPEAGPAAAPVPIATSGDLSMMPPASGLPVSRASASLAPVFDAIPHVPEPAALAEFPAEQNEPSLHG